MKHNLIFLFLITLLAACGGNRQSVEPQTKPSATHAATNSASAVRTLESLPKIVAFGDSLTAGYGLAPAQSYPSLLQEQLQKDGYRYEVVNAGVSGDTSAGGVRRLDWALDGDVKVVIVELGANDMLRGLPVKDLKENLRQIIQRAQAHGATVVLAGMYATTNSGQEYQKEFRDAFESLTREYQLTLIPFFLDRVAGIETLNQADGVHPNAEGTKIVAETVYRAIKPILDKQRAAS